jgi:hypothetical protein
MFDKLKKMLGSVGSSRPKDAPASGHAAHSALGSTAFGGVADDGSASPIGVALDADALSRWAQSIGAVSSIRSNGMPSVSGAIRGKPWRLEVGRSSREYIQGEEIRMRAELGVNDDAVVLVMSRQLKDRLEKAAYSVYTDPLQTTVDPNMPEEMRWLAMFEEFGWPEIGVEFFDDFAVLADSRARAIDFVSPEMAKLLRLFNRSDANGQQLPLVLMVMRGKAYMRTLHQPADLGTLAAAHTLFERACVRSLETLTTDLPL